MNWEGGIRVPGIFNWPGKIRRKNRLETACGAGGYIAHGMPPTEFGHSSGVHLDGTDLTSLLTGGESASNASNPCFGISKARPIVAMGWRLFARS